MRLHTPSEDTGGASVELVNEEGYVLKAVGNPTLDKLRELEREFGEPEERLNLLEAGLNCSECGSRIDERFSANPHGELLCWECAQEEEKKDENGISKNTDPTKAILSDSNLNHKSLCDYVINVATGCAHGCKFCYVPGTPNITTREEMLQEKTGIKDGQRDWGRYLLYRDDLPERLSQKLDRKQEWNSTDRGRGVVMLSSGTDCYQDRRTAQITRGCVSELVKREIPVRILTRSPAVCRDDDLYSKYSHLVTVGSSIPSLDDEMVNSIEVNAPPPSTRLKALQELSDAGARVYVSMSPTYPTQNKEDIRNLLEEFKRIGAEVVFHEPINPRGGNFKMTIDAAEKAGQMDLAEELSSIRSRDNWVDYSLKHLRWVENLGEEVGIDVHLWPDRQLITEVAKEADSLDEVEHWKEWRDAVSKEDFSSAKPLA